MIELRDNFDGLFLKNNNKENALFLDFDGTISPIVPLPEDAYLPEATKIFLEKISKIWPVTIITGRDLKTIKEKVGLKGISYGASHGLEWEVFGKSGELEIEKSILEKINCIKDKIFLLKKHYKDLIVEEKKFSFAFHYQLLDNEQKFLVKNEAENILLNFSKDQDLKIFRDRETIEILPNSKMNKGDISKKILDILEEKTGKIFLPIYIGDGLTDEDAFRIFKEGITIRVGYMKNSNAKYYFRDREDVDFFLKKLVNIITNF